MSVAIGTFADLPLWADPDTDGKRFHRDLRAHVLADPCPTCGAIAGAPCQRETIAGPMTRRLPHTGRGGRSLGAHNTPSHRGRYKRRGVG